jgi:hypothetical protein
MVSTKFGPWRPYNQLVRTMTWSGQCSRTAISPCHLVRPYAERGAGTAVSGIGDLDTARTARRRHEAGAGGIDRLGLGFAGLGGIDLRPGGPVDDGVGPDIADHLLDRIAVGDVAFPLRAPDHVVTQAQTLIDDVAAELPGRAEHQILQRRSLRRGAATTRGATPDVRARRASGRRA